MYLWIDVIKALCYKGYSINNKNKCLKHIEYPSCKIEGIIPIDTLPLIPFYELIEIIEGLGSKQTIQNTTCIVTTNNKLHIEWLEQIGGSKIPSDISIEVNILPLSNKSIELSMSVSSNNLECYIDLLKDNSYTALINVNSSNINKELQAIIIWECEFDNILNKGIYKVLNKYFGNVITIGVCKEDYELQDYENVDVILKLNIMNYITKTISVQKISIGETSFNEVLISELNYYLSINYDQAFKV